MFVRRLLKKTKQRPFNTNIYGFDLETHGQKNEFYCGSVYKDDEHKWTFFKKQDLINFFKSKNCRDSVIFATNLGFDFFGTFKDTPEMKNFNILFRGSHLINARSRIVNSEFVAVTPEGVKSRSIKFVDTMNYAPMSVQKLGKLIGIDKITKPSFLGRLPQNDLEVVEMVEYNMKDAEISKKSGEFLMKAFYDLGATPKDTIASTSMSLFKNKYLDRSYIRNETGDLLDIFKAYYGGRTEVFKRGLIKDYFYYDFNSLYPSVMLNEFPDPNSIRVTYFNDVKHINFYEGVSHVDIFCPYMDIPLLPFRSDDKKLTFPTGDFSGWYSHVELRKAIDLGYVIKKVHKSIYFKEKCKPFVDYVTDLYTLRLKYKSEGSSMELACKLLMNSLYGKFGQKFTDIEDWKHFDNLSQEQIEKFDSIERIENFARLKKDMQEPSSFCINIWAVYVSAYGRLKLYDVLKKCDPVYCDTDSIVTKEKIPVSDVLGDLKLEYIINEGVIVKPKMYMINGLAKLKGVRGFRIDSRLTGDDFVKVLGDGSVTYQKFIKFKESLRRGLCVNELVEVTKKINLEDSKRDWYGAVFNPEELQVSRPLNLSLPVVKEVSEHEVCSEVVFS